jgi:hypothetical protein
MDQSEATKSSLPRGLTGGLSFSPPAFLLSQPSEKPALQKSSGKFGLQKEGISGKEGCGSRRYASACCTGMSGSGVTTLPCSSISASGRDVRFRS